MAGWAGHRGNVSSTWSVIASSPREGMLRPTRSRRNLTCLHRQSSDERPCGGGWVVRTSDRAAIPALTGLRFIAAASVLISHGLLEIMPFQGDNAPSWYTHLSEVAAEGMPLFFVLSGFVI